MTNFFSVRTAPKLAAWAMLAILALMWLSLKNLASDPVTALDFEDLPESTIVQMQYTNRGVVLPNPGIIVTAQPPAHSGRQLLQAWIGEDFNYTGPFVIRFTSGQARVKLFAGASDRTPGVTITGTLRAYDAAGALVAQDGPKAVIANACTTAFEVKTTTSIIRRIELAEQATTPTGQKYEEVESLDDLEFEGAPPPPVNTITPTVKISSPANGLQLDAATLTVQGTVAGKSLAPTATLTVEVSQPPNKGHLPPSVSAVPLAGTGDNRTFSIPVKTGIGPQKITLEARTMDGLVGSASVTVTNLPNGIRTRFGTAGGAGTFGNVQWAVTGDGCTIAIYEKGAIAAETNTTRVILGGIFNKWFQWTLANYGIFYVGAGTFCPTEEACDAPDGTRAQNFRKGRIYDTGSGIYYVPSVFAQAIDQLGGEVATGIPISDPERCMTAHTWLFQQFKRPGQPGLPCTLEIKGSPPTLWVERQGGDLTALAAINLQLTGGTATLAQSFPCAGNEGPCTITPPSSGPPIPDAVASKYGNGGTYPGTPGVPEWKAVKGDYVLTPVVGFVKDSHLADGDNPFAHEYSWNGLALDPYKDYPSDWNIDISPIHPYRNLLREGMATMELEFEYYFARYFFLFVALVEPQPGDLLFASGRWIIDCGHPDYGSEIHPPSVLAYMNTKDTTSPSPTTMASIWVNGFYPGDPVDIDIFPPPRPAPNASLVIEKPKDSDAALDVNVKYTTDPDFSTYVRVNFSASPRRVQVTDVGEMKWQTGRSYQGNWFVKWDRSSTLPVEGLNPTWWP
jgi:hypothetical protein